MERVLKHTAEGTLTSALGSHLGYADRLISLMLDCLFFPDNDPLHQLGAPDEFMQLSHGVESLIMLILWFNHALTISS